MPSVRELRARGLGVDNGHNKNQLMDKLRNYENSLKSGSGVKKVKNGRKKPRGLREKKKGKNQPVDINHVD